MFNIAVMLEDSARTVPDRDAVVCGSVRMTVMAQVEAAANQVANLLVARGIEPGDKVALTCPNLPAFAVVYYGILKAGAVVVPLNVLFKAREVAYHLDDSDALAYVCFEGPPDLPMGRAGWEGFNQTPGCANTSSSSRRNRARVRGSTARRRSRTPSRSWVRRSRPARRSPATQP